MKLTKTLIALSVVASLALVGCGSSNNAGSTSGNQTSTTTPAPAQDAAATIKPGAEKMISISSDLKKAIDAGDEAKVKTTGPQLEDAWKTFEDAVKAKFPDSYAEIETSLDPTIAGSQATPLDKAILSKSNDQLSASLNKLAQQAK